MKFIMLSFIALLLSACDDSPSTEPAKIAAPQREALEKAKGVEQGLQKANEAQQKKIEETTEK
jgi:hypothetical protein